MKLANLVWTLLLVTDLCAQLLLGTPSASGRAFGQNSWGLFRLLSEEHTPFAVSDNMAWLGKRYFDLVIASDWVPAELKQYAENGGTNKPGIVYKTLGRGQAVWLPWDLGGLYYRLSLPAHAALFHDVVERLYPKRQLIRNAHRLVEIAWMKQGDRRLLHLINLSGHSQTGYFPPINMNTIRLEIEGQVQNGEDHSKTSPVGRPGARRLQRVDDSGAFRLRTCCIGVTQNEL